MRSGFASAASTARRTPNFSTKLLVGVKIPWLEAQARVAYEAVPVGGTDIILSNETIPHMGTHTEGCPVQTQPFSTWHADEQPSFGPLLASSHPSPGDMKPSAQMLVRENLSDVPPQLSAMI